MDGKFYIKKLIRDDGAQLAFDANEIYLDADNTLLVRPDPSTTAVEYTEADGGEMVRQHNMTYQQQINGLIVPRTSSYWDLSARLGAFFKINHNYKIVYVKIDGSMFKIERAWISAGLQVHPTPREDYSEWSVSLTIGDTSWSEYSEDAEGNEIYSNAVVLPLLTASAGGEIWDSVGLVSDNVGEEWEAGNGGVQTVNIASTQPIYPVWVVHGPCVNPQLQNNTTDTVAKFNGTVADRQTLTVNFAEGTAYLNSALVTRHITGLVSFAPGDNIAGFNSDGGATESSTISWDNIIS